MEREIVIEGEIRLESSIDGEADLSLQEDGAPYQIEEIAASDHNKLYNRDMENQHPISSITGLTETLASKVSSTDLATIAYTARIEDLVQDAPVVIYCGTASEV